MSLEDSNPLIRIGKDDKEQKTINAYGLWCTVATLLTVPFWSVAMTMLNFVNQQPFAADWDPNRAIYDGTGKLWSKAWLSMIGCFPSLSGDIDLLKEGGHGPCLYVANHASWLDIPILCTVLDPVFKFIAKGELKQVPCIGQQLEGVSTESIERTCSGRRRRYLVDQPTDTYWRLFSNLYPQGDHILIDREDRRSQLRTFKEGISWLRKGVPLMAFPEGKRSDDGRLIDFKGGLFSMAVKTGVPIVPLTISHAHAVMPSHALLPVQSGRGKLHVHVHAPIDSTGRTDAELSELVRKVFLSDLPLDHHPEGEEEATLLSTSAEEPVIHIPTLAQHPVAHHESAHSDTIRHAAINPPQHATTTTPTAVNDGRAAIPHSAIDVNDDVTEKV